MKLIDSLVGFDAALARLRLRRMRAMRSDRDREVFLNLIARTEGAEASNQARLIWGEDAQLRAGANGI